jgi:hypothetical protein
VAAPTAKRPGTLAGRSASALSSASACGVGIWLIQDSAGRSSSMQADVMFLDCPAPNPASLAGE